MDHVRSMTATNNFLRVSLHGAIPLLIWVFQSQFRDAARAGVLPFSLAITCPTNTTVQCALAIPAGATGSAGFIAQGGTISGDCPGPMQVSYADTTNNRTCPNRFTITRSYSVADLCGNTVTCDQTITVNDTTGPEVTCPTNVTVQCASAVPAAAADSASFIAQGGSISEHCGGAVTVISTEATNNHTCPGRFTITRTYRLADDCNNVSTCDQTITINDTTAPIVTCATNVTVQCAPAIPAAATDSVSFIAQGGTITEACGGAVTVTSTEVTNNQTCPGRFTVTRTYMVADLCGNTETCAQTITVRDTTGPEVTCPTNVTVQCPSAVPAAATDSATFIAQGGTIWENCGAAVTVTSTDATNNQTSPNRFMLIRSYRVADSCNNSSTCDQMIMVECADYSGSVFPDLKPFPLSANQRGTVTCLENPSISYDIFLPPAYSTNGPPLPIIYTLHPNGGGMVSDFQTVCSRLNIITVGIVSSKNSVPWNPVLRDFYAVPRDIRQRVLFDPSAVFVGGLSGGAENSYVFSRFWAQHVSGVLAMGGWLGRANTSSNSVTYYSTDRVQTNLFVARTTGTSDSGAVFYNPFDSDFLASCGAVVNDWFFSGGHTTAPDSVKTECLNWLSRQRIPVGSNDQYNSLVKAASWRSRVAMGHTEAVLRECVLVSMNQPRSWFALEAQLVMDDLMSNYNSIRSLDVSSLAQGDFASDLFYYSARGAAANYDQPRYYANLKALTGITSTSGDRPGDIYYMLTNFYYTGPLLERAASQTPGQINLRLAKDTPGLSYSLQSRTNLVNDVWRSVYASDFESSTTWSSTFNLDPGSASRFYRVGTTPLPGESPPWPDNGGKGQ